MDASGCTYVTGLTESTSFPMENAYDSSQNGSWDAFVTKLSAIGDSLVYSTFLGGVDWDESGGIAVDGASCAYVTGLTWSSDFPTENAYDSSLDGLQDAFVTKFTPAGNSLAYSTFLNDATCSGIAVDGSDCAYVTGVTHSTEFPAENAYDDSYNGGNDAFVTKLSPFVASCCTGPSVGNVDGSADNLITMGDLVVLIDHMFITLEPLVCLDESNVDLSADGLVTMGDLTVMIDALFISLTPLPPCP